MSRSRPTWVFVAGTYRSASTMHYLMTEAIVERTNSGKGIGYHTEDRLMEFDVEGNKPYVVCKVFQFLPDGFRRSFEEQKGPSYGKAIRDEGRMMSVVSVRDPRDIIVSMRKRGDGRGGGFDFERVATESLPEWLGDVVKWIDFDPARSYWSRFEEFTQNLLRETRAIARHLKIDLADDLAKDIAAELTISAQRKRQEEFKKAEPNAREHPWLPSIPGIVFGSSGHWRTWLAASEARMVEDANRAFMERFGYL